jgi:hypothetical protein
MQAAFCRLDEALLTFGFLVMQYTQMSRADPHDAEACSVIISSLESRWAKADQLPFIVCILVNPFYRNTVFARVPAFFRLNLQSYIIQVYEQIMQDSAPLELIQQFTDYLNGSGVFSNISSFASLLQIRAENEVNMIHLFGMAKILIRLEFLARKNKPFGTL